MNATPAVLHTQALHVRVRAHRQAASGCASELLVHYQTPLYWTDADRNSV